MVLDFALCLVLGTHPKIPEGWLQGFADWRVPEHDFCDSKMEYISSKCANSYLKYLKAYNYKLFQITVACEKQSKQSTAVVVNHADTFFWTVTCMTKLFAMVRELCLRCISPAEPTEPTEPTGRAAHVTAMTAMSHQLFHVWGCGQVGPEDPEVCLLKSAEGYR